MLTTNPHLYIRRPSPTVAEFTVTTCPPLTLPLRLALLTVLLLRATTVFLVLLALYTQYGGASPPQDTTTTGVLSLPPSSHVGVLPPFSITVPETVQIALAAIQASPLGQAVARAAAGLPVWGLLGLSGVLLWGAVVGRIHTTESVLVLRGLGIQTSSSSGGLGFGFGYLARLLGVSGQGGEGTGGGMIPGGGVGVGGGGGGKTRFIPTAQIQDVLINEAFRGFEVVYYLIIVVEGEEDVVVVFPGLLPRRRIVEAVWRGVRGCLYEQDGEKERGVDRGKGEGSSSWGGVR